MVDQNSEKNDKKKKKLLSFKTSITSEDFLKKFEFVCENLRKEMIAKGIVKSFKYLYPNDYGVLMILKLYEYYQSSDIQAIMNLKQEQRELLIKQLKIDT
jgi:hypothetical protein